MKGQMVVKAIAGIIAMYICYRIFMYYYYKDYSDTQKVLIDKPTHFIETFKKVINRSEIFKPNVNFSLSWKMKILNIPSNFAWNSSVRKNKPIALNGGCPDIFYNPHTNELIIIFELLDTHSMSVPKTIKIKDIPVQSWVNYALIVKGRQVMFYINGELKHSELMENVPTKQTGAFRFGTINNNFLGHVDNFVYYNYPLKMDEVQSISF